MLFKQGKIRHLVFLILNVIFQNIHKPIVENNFFSEVGLIENAAQTCSCIVGQSYFLTRDNEIKENVKLVGFISGIKKATVFMLPMVNQTIKTSATLVSRFDTDDYSICTMKCATHQDENLLLESEINLFIQEVK